MRLPQFDFPASDTFADWDAGREPSPRPIRLPIPDETTFPEIHHKALAIIGMKCGGCPACEKGPAA